MNESVRPKSRRATDARGKVLALAELAGRADAARAEGRTVVLCHGVFDLLHMGHVRHFEAARREGDVLMVTVTADRHVNKGPGRPIFPEHMRAEMLAALGCIDFVAINDQPTAEGPLRLIKPNVYVKGSDYENPEEDVTGGIAREREAVEEHGGRLTFTKDITFSSSALINRYLDVYDPPLRDYLEKFRASNSLDQLLELIERARPLRVLLVGDTIIDEYEYVEGLGKASKENIVATRSKGKEMFAGGIIAAANHVAGFCAEVEVVTSFGALDDLGDFAESHVKSNVHVSAFRRPGVPTTRKTRFVEPNYMRKLFEVYSFDDTPPDAESEGKLNDLIVARARGFDLVVVADFGHGLIAPGTIRLLREQSRFLAVNAQTNAGNQGFNLITKYTGADYVCIDGGEARLAVSDKFGDLAEIAGKTLPERLGCQRLVITGGIHGCVVYDAKTGTSRIPAFTRTVVDTVGAGDAFLAITAPLVALGGDMERIGFIGNAAGALKVGIVGHRASIERVPLVKYLTTLMK
jgi:rfaE bifunctional protein nucleotidyltransferase chain/domain